MMLAILSFKNVLIYLMLHTLLSSCQCEDEDLYNVLGVSKSATQTEIKKAYKQLAREWHPDKNNEPGAHEKFLKINEAYETLGDKQKRAEYDRFGSTSSMHSHSGPDPFQNFDRFFHHGFDFNFGGNRRSNYDEYRITHRSYELKIVPESKTKPYIIYANSHMCFECRRIEPIWDKVIQDLKTIGMGIGVASRQNDITLFSTLKIHYVPAIIAVLDGRPTFIRGDFGVHAMRDHIRRLFPRNLITKITDSNYKNFLNGWHDNRVRVLLFSKREQPTLRFVLMAYAFRHRICAGYVRLGIDDTSEISLMFNIQSSVENILFFNEDTTMPVASLRMRSIARSTMDDLAESHKYLMLPRISCPAVFHELCPPQSRRTEKKYCVILVTRNNAQHGQHRSSFLQFAQNYSTKSQNVRFSYIYEDSQNDFVSAVTKGRGSESGLPALKIVFLWHNMENKIFFDIMDNGWSTDEQKVDVSKQTLTTKLNNLLTKPVKFPHNIDLPKITDEHANSIFVRILLKLLDWWDVLMEYFWSMDPVATFTALFFIGMTFLIMYVGASAENEQINQTKAKQETVKKRFERREFNIHPFNFATYKELVHKAEPGHITIMVLVEEESREKMLSKFAEVVFPYSKSVYIKFAFLLLEEYLPWYKHLLEETLDFQRELDINKKNCVGTVIAINGHRKYYCLYHPTVGPRQRQARDTTEQNGGDFLGMQESDSENEDEHLADIRFHDDIFENLNVWMDRMYEGSLKRLPVQYWPSLTDMHSGACHSKTD